MVKFNPKTDIPDLNGKHILVTGGNSGLGAASIAALAAHNPSKIYLGARTRSKADAAVEKIKASTPSANIEIIELDIASFESVKNAAARINNEPTRLDILMLNAGIAASKHALTSDGYELQFGTNHMGHALLTQLLMPTLLRTAKEPGADVRVVAVSSVGAKRTAPKDGILYDQLKTPMESFGGMALYGQSKLANICFAKSLARAYPQLTCSSLHPGNVATPIYAGEKASFGTVIDFMYKTVFLPVINMVGDTPETGAFTQLWCSVSKDVKSGAYYEPVGKPDKESALAKDEAFADKLWDWTSKELQEHGAPGWAKA